MAMHTFTSSTTPAPDPTTTSQPVPPDVDARNSIPFSFLIAFLALFVAFMAMGLWARRIIFIVRRRLGLPIPEPPQRRTDSKPKRPMVWDICPGKGRESIRWDTMQASTTAA
ncbi:hypothetical protein PHLCEN_2v8764 [Hermanssonia centrifuga]|uniref:Uncharacterized protein n=1 Tax=Hermanssonia centrifuga TaxID=98765 RepID=A0A2R6NSS0_9APHY|nr:hypothetical protein PHLCEN_2v8764 [Hermanssonia centrifuga]